MTPAKPMGIGGRHTGEGLATGRHGTERGWDRLFGFSALAVGLVFLLTGMAVVPVATLAAVFFLVGGAACAIWRQETVGVAAFALGLVLLLPLSGHAEGALVAYRFLVGTTLGVFGIVKLT